MDFTKKYELFGSILKVNKLTMNVVLSAINDELLRKPKYGRIQLKYVNPKHKKRLKKHAFWSTIASLDDFTDGNVQVNIQHGGLQ